MESAEAEAWVALETGGASATPKPTPAHGRGGKAEKAAKPNASSGLLGAVEALVQAAGRLNADPSPGIVCRLLVAAAGEPRAGDRLRRGSHGMAWHGTPHRRAHAQRARTARARPRAVMLPCR